MESAVDPVCCPSPNKGIFVEPPTGLSDGETEKPLAIHDQRHPSSILLLRIPDEKMTLLMSVTNDRTVLSSEPREPRKPRDERDALCFSNSVPEDDQRMTHSSMSRRRESK